MKVTMSLTLVSIERESLVSMHGVKCEVFTSIPHSSNGMANIEVDSTDKDKTKCPIIRSWDIQLVIKCDGIKEQGISMFILKISLIYFRQD